MKMQVNNWWYGGAIFFALGVLAWIDVLTTND